MTDELKCPFCGAELYEDVINDNYLSCRNYKCDAFGSCMRKSIWQALIDGKRAQDAIKVATEFIEDIAYCNSKIRAIHFSGASAPWIAAALDKLHEIASITKQEK